MPLKTKTARTFLNTVETVAPWFLDEGLLNIPQWDQLGEDFKKRDKNKPLPQGTLVIWTLVRGCLGGYKPKCDSVIQEGAEALEEVKEERSSLASERGSSSKGEEEMSGEELEWKFKLKPDPPCSAVTPNAPPPYNPLAGEITCKCHPSAYEDWKTAWRGANSSSIFPVLEDQNHQRYHQPLDFKLNN